MKAVDSSVVIAAFASWHEHHQIARKAMTARPRLIAPAAVESYSVLTRWHVDRMVKVPGPA